jgi:MFS family permease
MSRLGRGGTVTHESALSARFPHAASDERRPAIVLGICVATGFTTLLDQSIFTLAVPRLHEGLHASAAQLQLIISIYSVAFGIALVPAGRLGDVIGRRRLFLFGLAMFAGFSVPGGLAGSAWVVVVSRLLQGLGAGIINTQVLGLIQDLFQGHRQARALGRYASAGGLSGLVGPLAGGVILALVPPDLGWRLLFLVNVPFGVLIFVLAWRLLPRDPASAGRPSIDVGGLVLLSSVTLAMMSATLVGERVLLPARGWLLTAGLGMLLFLAWEAIYARRGGVPILAPGLIRSPGYVLGTVVAMCQFASGLTSGMIGALFFLDGLRIGALSFAALSITGACGMIVSSSLSWRYAARFGRAGGVAAIAAHILTVAAQGLAIGLLPAGAIVWIWPLLGLLQGLASGLIHAPNQAMTLAEAAGQGRGLAAGYFQLSQRLACAIGMSWGTGVFLLYASRPGGLDAYRAAFCHALVLVLLLSGSALAAASADWARRRATRSALQSGVSNEQHVL